MSKYESWVHGHQVQLERRGSLDATDKGGVGRAFDNSNGDLINLGSSGSAACLRLGWGARFVVYDNGFEDNPKSGGFWCHYAIPTPFIKRNDDDVPRAETVLINFETYDESKLTIEHVHVWDGNRRIFAKNDLNASSEGANGGIPSNTTNAGTRPNINQLWEGNLRMQDINFGIGVSIFIRANSSRNGFLEIRGVGVIYEI